MPFLRNIAVLAGGTAMAQVLTVLAYPVLMRLFDPTDFGLFALFGAIVMTVSVAASWRYELAIVLVRSEKEAVNLLVLSMAVVLGMSLLAALLIAVAGKQMLRSFGAEDMEGLLFWLPLGIFCAAAYTVMSYWATRHKLFKRLSLSNVSRSAGVAGAQMGLGFAGMAAPGLVLGQIVGQVVAVLALSTQIARRDWRTMARLVRVGEMRRLAFAHRDFPFYNMPRALLNSTTISVPSILLTAFFGAHVAGLYWFAYRLLEMPMTLLGDATRRVFYQRAVELSHQGKELSAFYLRTSGGLALMAAPPALALVVAGPWLFGLVFGEAWRESGVYMQWLALWWFMRFVNLPSIMLVPVLNLQRAFLMLEAAAIVPRFMAIPLAAFYADTHAAIAGYAAVGFAFHLASSLVVWHRVRRNDARLRSAAPLPA